MTIATRLAALERRSRVLITAKEPPSADWWATVGQAFTAFWVGRTAGMSAEEERADRGRWIEAWRTGTTTGRREAAPS